MMQYFMLFKPGWWVLHGLAIMLLLLIGHL
jgi:hypothetical protein